MQVEVVAVWLSRTTFASDNGLSNTSQGLGSAAYNTGPRQVPHPVYSSDGCLLYPPVCVWRECLQGEALINDKINWLALFFAVYSVSHHSMNTPTRLRKFV